MKNKIILLSATFILSICVSAQSFQRGPYTVVELGKGVFHIQDANDSNPPGSSIGKDGKPSLNNCSDMYLIKGGKQSLLIDLSNAVKWDTTATQSLRSIVYELSEGKDLLITVTHKHGDHLGMLPAFSNDKNALFILPEKEFNTMTIFPKERTKYFKENESIDLGGKVIVNTMEVQGHTEHSTIFILKGKNMIFSGDAIGSGNGVWLFNYESFITYSKGIENLVKYIEDPANLIDSKKLVIYGGHAWQKGKLDKLTSSYIYDMQTLIKKIGENSAESDPMSTFMPFLNTNFKYGTAYITWNKDAAAKYRESLKK